jgi:hypothetical protein
MPFRGRRAGSLTTKPRFSSLRLNTQPLWESTCGGSVLGSAARRCSRADCRRPSPPMTLGDLRGNGTGGVLLRCRCRSHSVALDADDMPDEVDLPSTRARRLRKRRGVVGAEAQRRLRGTLQRCGAEVEIASPTGGCIGYLRMDRQIGRERGCGHCQRNRRSNQHPAHNHSPQPGTMPRDLPY